MLLCFHLGSQCDPLLSARTQPRSVRAFIINMFAVVLGGTKQLFFYMRLPTVQTDIKHRKLEKVAQLNYATVDNVYLAMILQYRKQNR